MQYTYRRASALRKVRTFTSPECFTEEKKCLGESSPPSVFFLLAKKSLIFTTPPPPPPPHRTRTRPAISTWQQHMPRPRERERKIRVPFSLRQISPFARSFVLRGYMTTLFSLSALFLRKIDLKGDEESLVSPLFSPKQRRRSHLLSIPRFGNPQSAEGSAGRQFPPPIRVVGFSVYMYSV